MHMDALKSSKFVIEINTHTNEMGSDFISRSLDLPRLCSQPLTANR